MSEVGGGERATGAEAAAAEALRAPSGTPDVFMSYASQDATVADAVVRALERAGLKCWIAPRDVVPGALYADEIVRAINEARVIVLVLSEAAARSSHVGKEIERASSKRRRIVALRTDAASLPRAFEYFLSESQWIDVGSGGIEAAAAKLVDAVRRHLAPTSATEPNVPLAPPILDRKVAAPRRRLVIGASAALIAMALAYFVVDKFWISKRAGGAPAASTPATAGPTAAATFAPPPHSIAVLPFVNLSGDKEQEYFSDGLTEELLNSLAEIDGLQVAARTSSFSFKEHPDVGTVAHKLNVAAVLEGSVRRSAHTIRITVQLINAVTGFHLWSKTYDRDLGDVLAMQTEIATAVAGALKVTLLGNVAAKVELGGTHNPAAFDAYLRGSKAQSGGHEAKDVQTAIDAFTEAIRLDHNYALAFAARSAAFSEYAGYWSSGAAAVHGGFDKAVTDGRKAIQLAPELSEGHRVLGFAFAFLLDFTHASEEYERAVTLASGNARVLLDYGLFAVLMGRTDQGIAAAHRAVLLDPLNRNSHVALGDTLIAAHHYDEAIATYQDALALDPAYSKAYAFRGVAQYALGDFKGASSSCEMKTGDFVYYLVCLAITYDKLGRHADAEAMLAKLQTWMGDGDAFQYAEIYAQWGSTTQALEWLETAMRLRDGGLAWLKTDPLLDPLRKAPRFQAIERQLKFPN